MNEEELLYLKKSIRKEQNYNRRNLIDNNSPIKVSNLNITYNINGVIEHNNLLNNSIKNFKEKHKLNKLPEYDKSVGANIFTLVKNIPNYLKNKKIISKLEKENESNDDKVFSGIVEFNKKRNSIRITLKEIINPKYRDTIESLYLRNDAYCGYWIKNCYSSNRLIKKR